MFGCAMDQHNGTDSTPSVSVVLQSYSNMGVPALHCDASQTSVDRYCYADT